MSVMSTSRQTSVASVDTANQLLRDKLLTIASTDGDYATDIEALSIHRRSAVTDPLPCIYDFGIAITVSGRKQVIAGNQVYEYGAGQALLASVDMPVVSRVMEAS